MSQKDKVVIFDTTLRDGEQAPGCTMTLGEKLEIARGLAALGVDVIEAGFPAASPGDFESVRTIAEQIKGVRICGLSRCQKSDIRRTAEAIALAERQRIHVFIATSPIHREHKLQMTKAEVIQNAIEGVRHARELCDDVEFSAEDASRTEPEFLVEVVEAVIEAGASTINIPDTVGYAVPNEFAEHIKFLRERVKNIDSVILSVHCHNDLGMAVANSISGVQAGARQIECTINGIGERAGNCSLEEVIMAIRTRTDALNVRTSINTQKLMAICTTVSKVTGIAIPRNKAIVGANAFAHEAGIHQHGMLKHRQTYEIMRPEDVGITESQLVLGKHSGRHAFRHHIERLGFDYDGAQLDVLFHRFKELADRKKHIYDADLEALARGQAEYQIGPWSIVAVQANAGTGTMPTAAVELRNVDGRQMREAACGDGPIDAVFNAIERITDTPSRLHDYTVRNVTAGKDAQGEVLVKIEHQGEIHDGLGVSTDVIEASARAFLNVMNRLATSEAAQQTQVG